MNCFIIPYLPGSLKTHSLGGLKQGIKIPIGPPNTFNNFEGNE
jgi:hypothetical protein